MDGRTTPGATGIWLAISISMGCVGQIGARGASDRTSQAPRDAGPDSGVALAPPAPFAPAPGGLQRLTAVQYQNTVRALLGTAAAPPAGLEPDTPQDGFTTISARQSSLSPHGVEQYD